MMKPTVVLVPGAWHKPSVYSTVIKALEENGYPTVGLSLPSVGATPAREDDFQLDVKAIRECLTELVVGGGKEVILVSHSYSGMPASEATASELSRRFRAKGGQSGGVIRLVFIMAFAMAEGFNPVKAAEASNAPWPEWMKMDAEGKIVTVEPADAKRIFYNDVGSADGDALVKELSHQSASVYNNTTTNAGWRYVPSTYVIGTNDNSSFTPELVDMIITEARKTEPSAFDQVEKCDGGHCLMVSNGTWLADVIRRSAGEVW